MNPAKKLPLFIITGAGGVGISKTVEMRFRNETDYIVMEGDSLWNVVYNTPDDGYRVYHELWLRVYANISQIGKLVFLCGCAIPQQFEVCMHGGFLQIFFILPLSMMKKSLRGVCVSEEM